MTPSRGLRRRRRVNLGKPCDKCGTEFVSTYDQKYCSYACAGAARNVYGPATPCETCGKTVSSRQRGKWSRFCSYECRGTTLKKAAHPRYARVEKECLSCHKQFTVARYRSVKAKYCSYECNPYARSKRYGKRDANHFTIHVAFERGGCVVMDLSPMGGGVPDLLVRYPGGETRFAEVKNLGTAYGKRGLSESQQRFEARGWPVDVVATEVDVDTLIAQWRKK